MVKILTLCFIGLIAQPALSKDVFKDNPYSMFSTKDNTEKKVDITWKPVANIQKECEKESLKRKLGGFGYPVTACSFWENGPRGHQCLILTSKNLNMHTLGHEMRHCFQGNYHP
jgi:hypothetical protein